MDLPKEQEDVHSVTAVASPVRISPMTLPRMPTMPTMPTMPATPTLSEAKETALQYVQTMNVAVLSGQEDFAKAKESTIQYVAHAKETTTAYVQNMNTAVLAAVPGQESFMKVKESTTLYIAKAGEDFQKAREQAVEAVSFEGKLTEEQAKNLAKAKEVAIKATDYVGSTFFNEDDDDERYGRQVNESGHEHFGRRFRVQTITLEEATHFGASAVYDFRAKYEKEIDAANNASLGYGARYKVTKMYPLAIKAHEFFSTLQEGERQMEFVADEFLAELGLDVKREFKGEIMVSAIKNARQAGHHVEFYKTKSVSFSAYVVTISKGEHPDPDEEAFLQWQWERWQNMFEHDKEREHVHKFLRIATHLVLGI